MHPVPSSPMLQSSQLTATTTLPADLTKPVQGDENNDGNSRSTQAMGWESPLLTLSVSVLANILETPKLLAANDLEIQDPILSKQGLPICSPLNRMHLYQRRKSWSGHRAGPTNCPRRPVTRCTMRTTHSLSVSGNRGREMVP